MSAVASDVLADFLAGPPLPFLIGRHHAVREYCPVHSHPALEIVFHVQGAGTSTLESGDELNFAPQSATVYAPHVGHDQRMQADGEDACILLGIDRPLPVELTASWVVPPIADRWLRRELLEISLTSADRPLARATLSHRATAVLSRLAELQSDASSVSSSRAQRPNQGHLQRARKYIGENFHAIESVDEVARVLDLSPDHLRHVFKRGLGTTLVGYLTEVRIQHARTLLRQTALPHKVIAAACGFKNERYFSEVFRKAVGMTPGEFRRRG